MQVSEHGTVHNYLTWNHHGTHCFRQKPEVHYCYLNRKAQSKLVAGKQLKEFHL